MHCTLYCYNDSFCFFPGVLLDFIAEYLLMYCSVHQLNMFVCFVYAALVILGRDFDLNEACTWLYAVYLIKITMLFNSNTASLATVVCMKCTRNVCVGELYCLPC